MKITFVPTCHVAPEIVKASREHTASLNLPSVKYMEGRPKLAVVGGGWSIIDHIDELRNWDGDIWACGSTYSWCRRNGIDATFFLIDPASRPDLLMDDRSHKAILANCCHPDMFGTGAEIEVFELISTPERANHGVTTMTAAPELSITMGYKEVHFFGGDSSFIDQTHVEFHDALADRIVVKAGEESYITCPEFLMQAEFLAMVIRLFPNTYKDRSGGLLGGLINEPEYDITHINERLKNALFPEGIPA